MRFKMGKLGMMSARLFMRTVVSALIGASLLMSPVAYARDLELLTRLLVPAYMAQNFAAICLTNDQDFLSGVNNGFASVSAFAEHVKAEVTAGISEAEAEKVRVMAANTARQVAHKELDGLRGRGGQPQPEAVSRWCTGSAKHFIVEIMRRHQVQHEEFLSMAEKGKR